MTDPGTCYNTMDTDKNGDTCYESLNDHGKSCKDFLRMKACDSACNLCACSTSSANAGFADSEHCSGHGTCTANCTDKGCTGAKCNCDSGYGGPLCNLGKFLYFKITPTPPININN